MPDSRTANPRRGATQAMSTTRWEQDSFGSIEVPADRLWGAQTQRSLEHFDISSERMPEELVLALAAVKAACARVNGELGLLPETRRRRSPPPPRKCCRPPRQEFPLSVWQTGSGTQSNMNINEVLANRASELLGGERGEKRCVHANDDVNLGQSSNDVFPTAMHLAAALGIVARDCCRHWPGCGDAGGEIGRFRRHRQDRPHPSAGRDAADAGPGVLGLRRATRARRSR
jgi:hypothetical protein